jgi:hypothetical protein
MNGCAGTIIRIKRIRRIQPVRQAAPPIHPIPRYVENRKSNHEIVVILDNTLKLMTCMTV